MKKSKHPNFVVGWNGTLEELVMAITNMSYDQVAGFTNLFATEIKRQGKADALRPSATDPNKKRKRLSRNLILAADYLRMAEKRLDVAWEISEKFTQKEEAP
jgi:hypothetical protein